MAATTAEDGDAEAETEEVIVAEAAAEEAITVEITTIITAGGEENARFLGSEMRYFSLQVKAFTNFKKKI